MNPAHHKSIHVVSVIFFCQSLWYDNGKGNKRHFFAAPASDMKLQVMGGQALFMHCISYDDDKLYLFPSTPLIKLWHRLFFDVQTSDDCITLSSSRYHCPFCLEKIMSKLNVGHTCYNRTFGAHFIAFTRLQLLLQSGSVFFLLNSHDYS